MESSRGPPRVKNKAAAPQQISAEQLLREAVDRQEPGLQAPTQKFADLEELHEFQGRKRKEFEDYVRRNRINMNNWMRYAQWELEQKEFRRARSVFERALDVDSTSVVLWIRYIEAEIKTRNINHARNLLNRAVTILPRIDKLWYKYVYVSLSSIPLVLVLRGFVHMTDEFCVHFLDGRDSRQHPRNEASLRTVDELGA
jgi:crooked neck